ncbi:hypothetical protein [Vagococcus salmoninarum]|uniref:Helix-turn-helix domain-containing protein n=1 Tax=Vagococcus salmoninarum TaxID=2739 RepID=A0A429ZTX2_9ENTE|nr:hypothetical protein [Vagococcus salmoninarum]MBE9390252.1 hypothetical protein [Vagococcus salmoninarum]RST97180.1 hypothetical protein CBF35_02715 [Vagococcus salmoninarum]
MTRMNYLVKEAAKELRCSENVVRNLIHDKRLRVMRMPTMIVPDFELNRFRQEVLNTQEDLSKYSDKRFVKVEGVVGNISHVSMKG